MKTIVVSDLHIGPKGATAVYAGGGRLPPAIANEAPDRVILNGDTFDPLLDSSPLVLGSAEAARAIDDCATSPDGQELLATLAEVLRRGGEVLVRPGNHDLELAVPAAQQALRARVAAMGERGTRVDRLGFVPAAAPLRFDVGDLRVLVTHGEHNDAFNRWLEGDVIEAAERGGGFDYPPGSVLVKEVINRIKPELPFIDLLKPDFRGAVLTALAVNPLAARAVISGATLAVLRGVIDNLARGSVFTGASPVVVDAWSEAILEAQLDGNELRELQGLLGDRPAAALGPVSDLLRKLASSALRGYAAAHRWLAADAGAAFFHEDPDPGEWAEAERLAREHDANVVIAGHTHARRWTIKPSLTYMNTGTWMWLMRLPAPGTDVAAWSAFLQAIDADPTAAAYREVRGTLCVIDPTRTDKVVRLEHHDSPPQVRP